MIAWLLGCLGCWLPQLLELFLLHLSFSWHPCLMPNSLDPALDISESSLNLAISCQPFLRAVKPETWHSWHSSLQRFSWCHGCLLTCLFSRFPLTPLTSLSLGIPWYPYLLASLFLETFSWHVSRNPILLTPLFLKMLHPFIFTCFSLTPLSDQVAFPGDLLSWHLLCLEVDVHSHVFLLASLSLASPFSWVSKYYLVQPSLHMLAQNTSQCQVVRQSFHRILQALLRTTKLAQSTSQHSVNCSTTPAYKACKMYLPVLLGTIKLKVS